MATVAILPSCSCASANRRGARAKRGRGGHWRLARNADDLPGRRRGRPSYALRAQEGSTAAHTWRTTMSTPARFSEIASLLGEPARAVMLHALMDGRALTASELAGVAGVTPQTASGHLARLVDAGLLRVAKQGRHRYHRLASPEVARMVEGIMQVAAASRPAPPTLTVGPRDAALRAARTCYDHLAGGLGVALADALVAGGTIELDDDGGALTDAGASRMRAIRHRSGLAVACERPQARAPALPSLPRLERAPAASRRCPGRGALRALLRSRLDPARRRHARGQRDAGGKARARRGVRREARLSVSAAGSSARRACRGFPWACR